MIGLRAVQEVQKTSQAVEQQTDAISDNASAARDAAAAAANGALANKATLDAVGQLIIDNQVQARQFIETILAKIEEGNQQHEAIITAKLNEILGLVTANNAQVIASNEKAAQANELAQQNNAIASASAAELSRQAAADNAAAIAANQEVLVKIQQLLDQRLPKDICTTCTPTTVVP